MKNAKLTIQPALKLLKYTIDLQIRKTDIGYYTTCSLFKIR